MADLLILEPDANAADAMAVVLRKLGHQVVLADSADAAMAAIAHQRPEAIVMELTLPDVDGLVLVSDLGRQERVPAIMVVSDRNDMHDRVLALRLGADDFMLKPVETEEFVARIETVLRRSTRTPIEPDSDVLEIDGLMLNRRTAMVKMDDRRVDLTPTEFRLLGELASHPNEVVTRARLGSVVWGYVEGTAHLVDVHIGRMRQKLAHGASPKVVNVRNVGFVLETIEGDS